MDFDGVVLPEDLDVFDSWPVDEFVFGGLACDEGIDVATLQRADGIGIWDVLLDVFMDVLRCVLLRVVVLQSDAYCQVVCRWSCCCCKDCC